MTYTLEFTDDAKKVIKKWKKSNPNLHKKLLKLLHELIENPRVGTGHPEPLRGGKEITWSRRITAHDRIVYDIHDETITVLIVEVEGHYNDK